MIVQRIEVNNRRLRRIMVAVCESPLERARGLLLRDGWDYDTALMLDACAAIHTFGMKASLDVIFVDADDRIIRVAPGLRPWRCAWQSGAKRVWEFRPGAVAALQLQPGDLLRAC